MSGEIRLYVADAADIKRALEFLPEECRYHGPNVFSDRLWLGERQACCDTGRPSRARRLALEALESAEKRSAS